MKLCICSGGHTRSVALARAFQGPAIAVGINRCEPDKFLILLLLADEIHICCRLDKTEERIVYTANKKTFDHTNLMPEDIWGTPTHPDLIEICNKIVAMRWQDWVVKYE